MKKIYSNLTELIGNTPMLALERIRHYYQAYAHIIAKLEYFNPGGSIKDRVALAMIEDAEKKGRLHPDSVIIEPTSGNTGIGLAWIGCQKGYKVILVMSELMSIESRKLLKAFGATIDLTPGDEGMRGVIHRANELLSITPHAIMLGQFDNPVNPLIHELTTAKEIWKDTKGNIDVLVAGVGTGGSISGIAAGLKAHKNKIEVVAVEPESCPLLSTGKSGTHMIQGIGTGFIPNNYNYRLVNRVMKVSDADAVLMCRELALKEGLAVGFSSGAAVHAALQLARMPEYSEKNIITVLPDGGERYLSTSLYTDNNRVVEI